MCTTVAVENVQLNKQCYRIATQYALSHWAATIRFNGFIFKELYCHQTGIVSCVRL